MSQGSCSAVTWYEPIRLVYNKPYNHLRRRASRPLFLFDYSDVVDFRFLFRIELFNITNMDRWYILLKTDKFVLVENGKDFDRITSIKPANDRGSLKVSSTYAKSFLYMYMCMTTALLFRTTYAKVNVYFRPFLRAGYGLAFCCCFSSLTFFYIMFKYHPKARILKVIFYLQIL